MNLGNHLKDKVVVITGGAGIIGSAFSRAMASYGAKVVIIGRNDQKAMQFAEELVKAGYKAIGIGADVTNQDALSHAHDIVISTFGKTNILINCAGGNHPKATTEDEVFSKEGYQKNQSKNFFDLDLGAFNDVFGLNFTGTLLPIQIFAKDMIGQKDASIINITSMSGFTPLTKIPAYSAAKAAINNFTQWLAVHFADQGIRINAIAPGFFSTEQNKALLWKSDGKPTERAYKILSQTPMKRFGNPNELVGTLLWLLDAQASGFVTGVVVPVDGGFSAYSGV